MKNSIIYSIIFLCLATLSFGQGWERIYDAPSYVNNPHTEFHSVQQTPDGGYILGGVTNDSLKGYIQSSPTLLRTDANGIELWRSTYDAGFTINPYWFGIQHVRVTADGGFIAVGFDYNSPDNDIYLIKTDAFGSKQWGKVVSRTGFDAHNGFSIIPKTNGYVIGGSTYKNGSIVGKVIFTDLNGDTTATKLVPSVRQNTFTSFMPSQNERDILSPTSDGGYIMVGQDTGNANNIALAKLDASGNTTWTKVSGNPTIEETASSVIQTNDGGYAVVGSRIGAAPNIADFMYVLRTDMNGDSLWSKDLGDGGSFWFSANGSSIIETTTGQLIVAGKWFYKPDSPNGYSNMYVVKLEGNNSPLPLWEKTWPYQEGMPIQEVIETNTGGYAFVDSCYLIHTDTNGNTLSAHIRGHAYREWSPDCQLNGIDYALWGTIIVATNTTTGTVYYASADANGYYDMLVENGNYSMSAIPPNTYMMRSPGCALPTPAISLSGQIDTVDFPFYPMNYCPFMTVEISTPRLQRCMPATYTVNYCNRGTSPAIGAYVDVELDTFLSLTSAPPYTIVNGKYRFQLGTLDEDSCGSFNIGVWVSCNTSLPLGQTHCTKAHIYPDNVCGVSWTGPIIDVQGECRNDSLHFRIENKGTNMIGSRTYYIIEDHVMIISAPFNIPGGQHQDISIQAKSRSTYRLIAEQDLNFPALLGDYTATVFVEGCRPDVSGLYELGYAMMLSNGNSAPFVSVDCQENIGPYDPNDKRGFPTGYDVQHYIYDHTQLDYHIRFQNTGTATAQRVEIIDTLSEHLDVTSFKPGTASHPYTWEIYGDGVVKFTFDNIMLPDSNANEPASHGFVKFRIAQEPNNPVGTVIYNNANIYFDFNVPIQTNTTFHTIGDNFVQVLVTGLEESLQEEVSVKLYPNPFTERATLEVTGNDYNQLNMTVYDMTGKRVLHKTSTNNKVQLERGNLPQGVYIYKLEGDGELLNTGKFIVQ